MTETTVKQTKQYVNDVHDMCTDFYLLYMYTYTISCICAFGFRCLAVMLLIFLTSKKLNDGSTVWQATMISSAAAKYLQLLSATGFSCPHKHT